MCRSPVCLRPDLASRLRARCARRASCPRFRLSGFAAGLLALTPLAWPPRPAAAVEADDHDLGLIPAEVQEETPPASPGLAEPAALPAARLHKKLFLEDAASAASPVRTVPVPDPLPSPDWQNRTSFDLYLRWRPWTPFALTLSDRLSLIEQEYLALFSRQTARNDFREGYASWEVAANTYLEAGRINLRNGVALGYNPTDFFKTHTVVLQASLDPSAMRENRLGTLMARAEKIGPGSASIAYAPKLERPYAIVSDDWGVLPRLDATNSAHRVLGVASADLGDFSSQLLGYFEPGRSKVGLNLSRPLGNAVVAYVEWAGGSEKSLIARAFAYGQETGTIPLVASLVLPTASQAAFSNDAAAGASWTIAGRITLNFEYHLHQSGFTRQDWQNWFDAGSAGPNPSSAAEELWYIRAYGADVQEPATRHQIFIRADWPRAFTSKLQLSGFAFVDLYDGSSLMQVVASYYPSDKWTIALYGSANAGGPRSERGSMPQLGSGLLQVVRYL